MEYLIQVIKEREKKITTIGKC